MATDLRFKCDVYVLYVVDVVGCHFQWLVPLFGLAHAVGSRRLLVHNV